MRCCLAALAVAALLSSRAALAQTGPGSYTIEKERVQKDGRVEDRIYLVRRSNAQGQSTLYVTVQFRILQADGQPAEDVRPEEIVVSEDGRRVTDLEIQTPHSREPLTVVLAIDTSGSMAEHGKMAEARKAALSFLDRLDPQAGCGLILFDHKLRVVQPPTQDRSLVRRRITEAQPGGGTAYLDATAEALTLLERVKGRRAVVILTDGVDINSERKLADVVRQARAARVPLYTIGVGEPGKNEPVTSILVLDCSASMKEPAGENDEVSKMDALHRAAARFVDIMRPGARTALLPFSDEAKAVKEFSDNKDELKREIRRLAPEGDTALFDATHDAIETLLARQPEGKRAVVVMTDGKDTCSHRRRVREVIDEARAAQIPLHMLGLGRADDLDENVMRAMGQLTGGTYNHAESSQRLYEIFENLSILLHDDGIDEAGLRQLAEETGGKYFSAQDISRLRFIYQDLAEELQTTYTVTFPSLQQDNDGTLRDIDIQLVRDGVAISNVLRGGYNVQGVIVPEMDGRVYLVLLSILAGLLLAPALLRRAFRRGVPSTAS